MDMVDDEFDAQRSQHLMDEAMFIHDSRPIFDQIVDESLDAKKVFDHPNFEEFEKF